MRQEIIQNLLCVGVFLNALNVEQKVDVQGSGLRERHSYSQKNIRKLEGVTRSDPRQVSKKFT